MGNGSILLDNIFPVIGGIGLFIFGMKIMSEGLQTMAGTKLKTFLSAITKNRFFGIITGFIVTSIVQSSSATTVMLVSFVNAGLISLTQAISTIMGANIGTTMTAWVVSLFGFKVSIVSFALPAACLGVGMLFLNKEKAEQIGKAILGFSILFVGLYFLKKGVPNIKEHSDQLAFLQDLGNSGYLSILLFAGIGTLLTVIVQSSSATMAITITLAVNGWISFEIAAAMVLGENIGTTITATLAAIPASREAKRAARAHTLFNVLGLVWMLTFFYPFLQLIDAIIPGKPDNLSSIAFHLSMFHTTFNITNTLVLVWFIPYIEKLARILVKDKGDVEKPSKHLQYINPRVIHTPNLGVFEARKEIFRMGNIVIESYKDTMELIKDPHNNLYLIKSIMKKEKLTDILQKEISQFLSKLIPLMDTEKKARKVRKYFYIISYLERIADVCETIAKLLSKKVNSNLVFDEESRNNIIEYSEYLYEYMIKIIPLLDVGRKQFYDKKKLLSEAWETEKIINKKRDRLLRTNLQLIDKGINSPLRGLILNDVIASIERIGDHIYSIVQVLSGRK